MFGPVKTIYDLNLPRSYMLWIIFQSCDSQNIGQTKRNHKKITEGFN